MLTGSAATGGSPATSGATSAASSRRTSADGSSTTSYRNRDAVFLELLDRAVYRRPESPYLALLTHAVSSTATW